MTSPIYKIVSEDLWRAAERVGVFDGAPVDLADGFIHFSTAEQVAETARRHFAGQAGLLLVSVDPDRLGGGLRYEPSRGGMLFPHLYGPLRLDAVEAVEPLRVGPGGEHVFPEWPALPAAEQPRAPYDPAADGWTFADHDGFIGLVGPVWTRDVGPKRVYAFLAERRHANRLGVVHGGMIMTFVDEALGRMSSEAQGGKRQATIQLDTHFISGGQIGEFIEARCRIVRKTRSVLFMSAEVTVGTRVVATVSGVWKILGA